LVEDVTVNVWSTFPWTTSVLEAASTETTLPEKRWALALVEVVAASAAVVFAAAGAAAGAGAGAGF
jgi:hypothetical protein